VSAPHVTDPIRGRHRYLREPAPLHFPVEERVPETRRHLHQRTMLFQIVLETFGSGATVGSEQFIYWDPTDPKQCCAPDLFVRNGAPDAWFDTWKVWERGAPELVVEIASASDAAEGPWESKLARFRRLGAREIVRFDADDRDHPLRIWDGSDGVVVERDRSDPAFRRCDTLGVYFCVVADAQRGPMLRVARDLDAREILPTPEEARQRETEARQRETEARQLADRRIAELEAEIAKCRGL
jgi:Uma2 family endonuclease